MAPDPLGSHITGRWIHGDDTYSLSSPATGRELARVARATTNDVDIATQAAQAAHGTSRWIPMAQRAALCHRCADLIEAKAKGLAVELAEEHGKPAVEAEEEIAAGAKGFRLAAEEVNGRAGRSSGRGRPGGRHTFEEFTQLKTISFDVELRIRGDGLLELSRRTAGNAQSCRPRPGGQYQRLGHSALAGC